MEFSTGQGGRRQSLRDFVPVVLLLWMNVTHALDCGSADCDLVLKEALGQISSPCYPDKYPNSQSCRWVLQAPAGFVVQLSFLDFDLEEAPGCIYDHMSVNTGDADVKFCGPTADGLTLNSTGNVMEITFSSDFSVQKRGFSVSFRHVAVALRNQKVQITSGNGQVTMVANSVTMPTLSHFTLCFEVQRNSQKQREWLFTYFDHSRNIVLSLGSAHSTMSMIVDGVSCSVTSILSSADFTSSMKTLCLTWTSSDGVVTLYFEGQYQTTSCPASRGHSIPAGGQFRLGGQHALDGFLYNLRLWDYAMTEQQLRALTCDTTGNALDWDNSQWTVPPTLAQTDATLSCSVSPPGSTPLTTSCDSPGLGCPVLTSTTIMLLTSTISSNATSTSSLSPNSSSSSVQQTSSSSATLSSASTNNADTNHMTSVETVKQKKTKVSTAPPTAAVPHQLQQTTASWLEAWSSGSSAHIRRWRRVFGPASPAAASRSAFIPVSAGGGGASRHPAPPPASSHPGPFTSFHRRRHRSSKTQLGYISTPLIWRGRKRPIRERAVTRAPPTPAIYATKPVKPLAITKSTTTDRAKHTSASRNITQKFEHVTKPSEPKPRPQSGISSSAGSPWKHREEALGRKESLLEVAAPSISSSPSSSSSVVSNRKNKPLSSRCGNNKTVAMGNRTDDGETVDDVSSLRTVTLVYDSAEDNETVTVFSDAVVPHHSVSTARGQEMSLSPVLTVSEAPPSALTGSSSSSSASSSSSSQENTFSPSSVSSVDVVNEAPSAGHEAVNWNLSVYSSSLTSLVSSDSLTPPLPPLLLPSEGDVVSIPPSLTLSLSSNLLRDVDLTAFVRTSLWSRPPRSLFFSAQVLSSCCSSHFNPTPAGLSVERTLVPVPLSQLRPSSRVNPTPAGLSVERTLVPIPHSQLQLSFRTTALLHRHSSSNDRRRDNLSPESPTAATVMPVTMVMDRMTRSCDSFSSSLTFNVDRDVLSHDLSPSSETPPSALALDFRVFPSLTHPFLSPLPLFPHSFPPPLSSLLVRTWFPLAASLQPHPDNHPQSVSLSINQSLHLSKVSAPSDDKLKHSLPLVSDKVCLDESQTFEDGETTTDIKFNATDVKFNIVDTAAVSFPLQTEAADVSVHTPPLSSSPSLIIEDPHRGLVSGFTELRPPVSGDRTSNTTEAAIGGAHQSADPTSSKLTPPSHPSVSDYTGDPDLPRAPPPVATSASPLKISSPALMALKQATAPPTHRSPPVDLSGKATLPCRCKRHFDLTCQCGVSSGTSTSTQQTIMCSLLKT